MHSNPDKYPKRGRKIWKKSTNFWPVENQCLVHRLPSAPDAGYPRTDLYCIQTTGAANKLFWQKLKAAASAVLLILSQKKCKTTIWVPHISRSSISFQEKHWNLSASNMIEETSINSELELFSLCFDALKEICDLKIPIKRTVWNTFLAPGNFCILAAVSNASTTGGASHPKNFAFISKYRNLGKSVSQFVQNRPNSCKLIIVKCNRKSRWNDFDSACKQCYQFAVSRHTWVYTVWIVR